MHDQGIKIEKILRLSAIYLFSFDISFALDRNYVLVAIHMELRSIKIL